MDRQIPQCDEETGRRRRMGTEKTVRHWVVGRTKESVTGCGKERSEGRRLVDHNPRRGAQNSSGRNSSPYHSNLCCARATTSRDSSELQFSPRSAASLAACQRGASKRPWETLTRPGAARTEARSCLWVECASSHSQTAM